MTHYARSRHPSPVPPPSTAADQDLAARFLERVDGYRRRYEPAADSASSTPRPHLAQLGSPYASPPAFDDDDDLKFPAAACTTTVACRAEQLEADARDLVVMVHGTFAGRAEDEGDSWWQQGSRAWLALQRRLPAGVDMPERGEIFHWSGENSERARIKAGRDLLDKLLQLEASNRRYHLIGHSHGGSVIWHALRLATLRRESLDGLRTWTTVGTPFLHYRTHGALSFSNLINLILAVVLLGPAYRAFVGFFHFAWAAICGDNASIEIRGDHEVGVLMSWLRKPFLEMLHLAGVPLVKTEHGLRLGTYDPATGQTLFDYLFCSWEGWVVILVTLFGGYVFLFLASLFLNPVLESLRIRAEERLERTAMETYRGRWLGLWSPDDEAINGLRATLDMSVSFVAHMAPRDRILLSDYLAVLSQPYFWILAPTFNHFIRPLMDRAVRSLVVKTAQGNNRPAAEVVAVSPYPTSDSPAGVHPALPAELSAQLLEEANDCARDLAPKFRELLASPSFVSGLERFGTNLTGHELIHTSYFDNPEVLDLLALHVGWGRRDMTVVRQLQHASEAELAWFCSFKHSVRETVEIDAEHVAESSRLADAQRFGARDVDLERPQSAQVHIALREGHLDARFAKSRIDRLADVARDAPARRHAG